MSNKLGKIAFIIVGKSDLGIKYLHIPIHSAPPQLLLGTVLWPSGEGSQRKKKEKENY